MARPTEDEEWVEARIESWVETYKKSMLTPVILRVVEAAQPVTVARIAAGVASATGWTITERSMYRSLKRLQDSGFLQSAEVAAPRTGAKRKEISLTAVGARFLAGINDSLVGFSPPRSGEGAGA
ncbi:MULTISPECIES: PadR family transcriptional regulator [unclassified Arthrobacter]|uniref:PadR family transcriptional regulator n=1 Tax=unclassified Arthrobacter TaxID=235627 RepID=UPI0021021565|nr:MULTISPECIES: PadR family transcriptional regulator [unclassified Arthrobacter]MCQ1946748.1 PadR family transcriptional regulator [Arthrobacter sp. zg-Y1116]MCQ1987114.1 PadR family transcriptional regulator [Arthrobacter sp. zg-Y844]